MHELGIVFHVIDAIEDVCKEQELTDVSSVTLQVGEVSGIVPDYLKDCWKWAVKRTEHMKQADLEFEIIPGVTYCEDCEGEYSTVKYAKICPYCGSEHTYLIQGNETGIKEIEAV